MKICSKCGIEKEETGFRKWRTGCKACEVAAEEERREDPIYREAKAAAMREKRKDGEFKAGEAEKRRERNRRPEVRAKRAEYRKQPEVHAKELAYGQAYGSQLWVKERERKRQEHKRQDPEVRVLQAMQQRETTRKKRQFINLIKMERGCYDCGGMFPPEALDFDHLPGSEKSFNIGPGVGTRSLEETIQEIDKCQVVCATCHRLRTNKRRSEKSTQPVDCQ